VADARSQAVTNFWESGAEGELAQGRNLIKAVQTAESAPLYIFSALPSSSQISNGKYTNVHHLDNKVSQSHFRLQYVSLSAS
jgi:hypothetical protein